MVEALVNCALLDLRDDDGFLDGVTLVPPTPWSEFMDALRNSVGVEERECVLMELGDRWRGLRGGRRPFGDTLELLRCGCGPRFRAGEEGEGEAGRAVADAAEMESRLRDCERGWWLFVDDGGKGGVSLDTLCGFG